MMKGFKKKALTRMEAIRQRNAAKATAEHWQQRAFDMAQVGINAENKTAKLAAILAYICAKHGERIVISGSELALMPANAILHEEYDDETDTFSYACVRPKPKIVIADVEAVIQQEAPKIEVVAK